MQTQFVLLKTLSAYETHLGFINIGSQMQRLSVTAFFTFVKFHTKHPVRKCKGKRKANCYFTNLISSIEMTANLLSQF